MKKEIVNFEKTTMNPDCPTVKDVAPEELSQVLLSTHLIDVRQPEEYVGELGHIAGSKLLSLNELPERLNELPKDETVVFICRSGGRSGRAAVYALEHGFEHVYNLKGGMLLWNQLGLPVEKP